MSPVELLALTGGALSFGLLAIFVGLPLQAQRRHRRTQEKIRLNHYAQRLRSAVSELLASANSIEQGAKYQGAPMSDQWHRSMGEICQELVTLSETADALASVMPKGNEKINRKTLARAVNAAQRLAHKLDEMKRASAKGSGGC